MSRILCERNSCKEASRRVSAFDVVSCTVEGAENREFRRNRYGRENCDKNDWYLGQRDLGVTGRDKRTERAGCEPGTASASYRKDRL